ncbi:hypothetical protein ACLOJK_030785 [Asimina triloba]
MGHHQSIRPLNECNVAFATSAAEGTKSFKARVQRLSRANCKRLFIHMNEAQNQPPRISGVTLRRGPTSSSSLDRRIERPRFHLRAVFIHPDLQHVLMAAPVATGYRVLA